VRFIIEGLRSAESRHPILVVSAMLIRTTHVWPVRAMFASAPSVASAGGRLLYLSERGLIPSRPIAVGSTDDADGADAIFSLPAYFDHSGPGSTFPRERDFDSDTAEERLRPS
jgi:hypothetical protein